MSIRMIAVDLDDTFLDERSQVSERNLRAARAAMDLGALFVLNSGRMPGAMRAFAERVGVNAPVICYNGAQAYDFAADSELFSTRLDRDTARSICKMAEERKIYIQAFWNGIYYFPEVCERNERYRRKSGVTGQATGKPLSGLIPTGVYKLLMIGEAGDLAPHIPDFAEAFRGRANFMLSNPTLLECIAPGVDKGAAMLELARVRGVAREEILAFGDEQNDLAMIRAAGYGYAMANAVPAVREGARFVAPDHDEDGVAQVIESFIARNEMGGGA